jgi:hypothetical protein
MLNRYRTLMMPADETGDGGSNNPSPSVIADATEVLTQISPTELERIRDLLKEIKDTQDSINNPDVSGIMTNLKLISKNNQELANSFASLSASDVLDPDFISTLAEEMREYGVAAPIAFDRTKRSIDQLNAELSNAPGKIEKFTSELAEMEEGKIGKLLEKMGIDEFSTAVENSSKSVLSFQGIIGKSLGKSGPLRQAFDSINGLTQILPNFRSALEQAREGGGGLGTILKNTYAMAKPLAGVFLALKFKALAKAAFDFGIKLDDMSKSIGRTSGLLGNFDNILMGTYSSTVAAGVSIDEANSAIKAFTTSFTKFSNAAEGVNSIVGTTNDSLISAASLMSKFGVTADSTAKIMDHFAVVFGQTNDQVEHNTLSILTMGESIGIASTKIASDFEASSSRLSSYGKKSISVFKELESIVKLTGLAITSLTGIAEKFDKFDTAASSVAQLNAVLKTQLSTMDMMNATDSERIIMMREQVVQAMGDKNFEDFNRFEKMYIAQAMGLKDVAEAQRLLNMSAEEYKTMQDGMKQHTKTQEELKNVMKELVPASEAIKLGMAQLLLMLVPLINAGKAFGQIMQKISTSMGSAGAMAHFAGYAIIGLASALLIYLFPALAPVIAIFLIFVGVLDFFYSVMHRSGSPQLWQLPAAMGENFTAMADGIDSASGMLGKSVGALDNLWSIFHKPGSPMLYALPLAFAEGFVSIGDSVAKATAQLNEFVSLMLKVAQLDFKGFIALRTDSSGTSMVMGSESVLTSISEGKLRVDVNMPEFTMPEVHVKVFIGKEELKGMIRKESSLVAKKTLLGRA